MVKKCTGQEFSGEWSNMIGYKIGSSLAGVYAMAKTSLMKNFKHGWKKDMDANMATLFVERLLRRSRSFLGNLKPSDKQLGLLKTPTWGIFVQLFFPSCPSYKSLPQMILSWVEILSQPVHLFTAV
jgi:hypothetical protein